MVDTHRKKKKNDVDEEKTFRDISEELIRRIAPSLISYINPTAGLAATVLLYTTWILSKNYKKAGIENIKALPIEERLLNLRREIENKERMIRFKEKALSESNLADRETLEYEIELLKRYLENLKKLYKLESLKYIAWKSLNDTGDERIIKEFNKIMEKIERGENFDGEIVRIMEKLEELRKREIITERFLKRILQNSPI